MTNSKLHAVRWWERNKAQVNGDAAGVKLETVWLNHVGIVALLSVNRKGNGAPLSNDSERAIAALLRVVADSARQLRRSGPLLGIVIPETSHHDGMRQHVERLGRNQEWHRGDFILRYANNRDDAASLAEAVLFPFDGVQDIRIAVDNGEQIYLDALRRRMATEGMSEQVRDILSAVIEGAHAASDAIAAFQEEALSAIDRAVSDEVGNEGEVFQ